MKSAGASASMRAWCASISGRKVEKSGSSGPKPAGVRLRFVAAERRRSAWAVDAVLKESVRMVMAMRPTGMMLKQRSTWDGGEW